LLGRFVRSRDEDAFAELVGRHGRLVLGVWRRVRGNAQQAEAVFQATWLVLARKAATIRRPSTLATLLHGTARRLAPRCHRADARRRQRETRGLLAAPAVRQAMAGAPLAEVRKRLEELLPKVRGLRPGEVLRGLRAVEVLEHIASAEAQKVLEMVANEAADDWLTREAKASVRRLDQAGRKP